MNAIIAQKNAIRERLKAARLALPEIIRQRYDEAIFLRLFSLPQINNAERFFCFISSGGEVDTHAIIRQLLKCERRVAVPRILGKNGMIAVPFSGWDELEIGQLGILTPKGSEPMTAAVDICITPGLGFTTRGARLGFGRGYYDKWFSTHTVGCKIAIAYECQLVEQLPTDAHDIPVDFIVTEERIIDTRIQSD